MYIVCELDINMDIAIEGLILLPKSVDQFLQSRPRSITPFEM